MDNSSTGLIFKVAAQTKVPEKQIEDILVLAASQLIRIVGQHVSEIDVDLLDQPLVQACREAYERDSSKS